MPITTASEFEAVVGQMLVKIDKALYERGDPPKLKAARRDLVRVETIARDNAKLKEQRDALAKTAETIRLEMSRDEALHNDLWDLLDYIDYCT